MCTSAEEKVSFVIDDFIRDKDSTIWICKLDNGLIAYQDDDREGLEPSSWIRLKNYCHNNKVSITEMSIRFRSNEVFVGRNEEGFFFRRAILGGIGLNRKQKPFNRHYFLVGILKEGKVSVKKWQVPEMMLIEEDVRNPDDVILVGESLIVNQQNRKMQV